tara:strand:- start:1280 stop:1390 length:111 start_codon:yes stop_codon:yes gene_type:complete
MAGAKNGPGTVLKGASEGPPVAVGDPSNAQDREEMA